MAHEDSREEKAMREKLQRERDQLLSEKYSLEQTLQVGPVFVCQGFWKS